MEELHWPHMNGCVCAYGECMNALPVVQTHLRQRAGVSLGRPGSILESIQEPHQLPVGLLLAVIRAGPDCRVTCVLQHRAINISTMTTESS